MNSLVDIQNQIQKLQKQALDIKSREFDKTVQEIRAKMQAFGITVKDLRLSAAELRKGKSKAKAPGAQQSKAAGAKRKKTGAKVAPKFKGPNGELWSGRGQPPRWLAAELAAGKTRDDFAIKD